MEHIDELSRITWKWLKNLTDVSKQKDCFAMIFQSESSISNKSFSVRDVIKLTTFRSIKYSLLLHTRLILIIVFINKYSLRNLARIFKLHTTKTNLKNNISAICYPSLHPLPFPILNK